jgi:hypothetical protein
MAFNSSSIDVRICLLRDRELARLDLEHIADRDLLLMLGIERRGQRCLCLAAVDQGLNSLEVF